MNEISIPVAGRLHGRVEACLRQSFADHAWLIGYCCLYMAIVIVVLEVYSRPYSLADGPYVLAALTPAVAAVFYVAIGHIAFHGLNVRPFHMSELVKAICRDERFTLERAAYALFPLLLVPMFTGLFTSFKSAIPYIFQFTFDPLLMELDKTIHGGSHPWEILHPVLGYPIISSILSYLYNAWFGLMHMIFWWQVFSLTNKKLRMQYIMSFVFVWSILGSLLALFLSSAGPCYYSEIVGSPNPFEPLMAYLHDAANTYKNWSLVAQGYLWDNYVDQGDGVARGISAMPSLHVAIAVLQALMGWKVSRKLGAILTAYAAIVWFGSIHLGWHYALDGYASVILVVVIWTTVGLWLKKNPARWDSSSESPYS